MNLTISLPKIQKYNNINFQNNTQPKSENSKFERTPNNDKFELSVGYVNDLHGQTNNMMRILSGIKGDIVLSAGDNHISNQDNRKVHDATAKFLNLAGVNGTALGNHEMDTVQGDLKESASKFNGKILAANINQVPLEQQDSAEIKKYNKTDINNFIDKSTIIEVKGEKIGLIGATPVDLSERWTHPEYHKDISVSDLEKTTSIIQNEINKLREQGVNKIFLLSHLGIERDKQLIKNTDGIDVVIGGHTHELIEGINEGENLVYSKSGEPVIITEAGKDGKHFGLLNLEFNKDGIITKAQNNMADTSLFHRNLINQYLFNEILGKPEKVGYIEAAMPAPKSLLEENPHANFMCDAMRIEMDADIALWNNGGPRNFFRPGIVDSSDIKDIAPFTDNVSIAEVSEQTLVNAFKKAVEISYSSIGNKPGLLAVSGLNYKVNPQKGILTGMNFIDKNGVEHKIDIENPRTDKTYKVVTDSYMMSKGADYDILSPEEQCIEYPFNKDFVTCEYIRHLNKPIVINQIGRITYEA